MLRWEVLSRVKVPGSGEELSLHKRGTEFLIKVDGHLLMSNHTRHSEGVLAEIGCARIVSARAPVVLVGGLGMGYTLADALKRVGPGARVHVSELMPAVVEWNRGPIGHLAGNPLNDPRVVVLERDIALVLRESKGVYDAILQDVDNGPEGLTMKANDWLYSEAGLKAAWDSMRPGGVLALWSAKPNKEFVKRMRKGGFEVREHQVRGKDGRRGPRHVIWTARRS